MATRILVPLNETKRSERAVPIAAALARRMDATLVFVSVIEWPFGEHPGHPGYHERLMHDYPDLAAESIVVKSVADPATVIRSICRPTDIICIGADHTSALGEMTFTSVFYNLLRTHHGPIVAVGPKATMPEEANRMIVCVDGFEHSEQGLALVPALANKAQLQTWLVEVVDVDGTRAANRQEHDVDEAAYVRGLAPRVESPYEVEWEVLHGDPVTAIAAYSSHQAIAAIAFATDALNPLARLFTPSLANELLKVAERPLVLIASTVHHKITSHKIPRVLQHAGTKKARSDGF